MNLGERSLIYDKNGAPYGVCHFDETYLQFNPYHIDYVSNGLNDADYSVSKTILKLWKNFIKYGNASTEGEVKYWINNKYVSAILS